MIYFVAIFSYYLQNNLKRNDRHKHIEAISNFDNVP